MFQTSDIALNEWPARERRRPQAATAAQSLPRASALRFKPRRASVLGFAAIAVASLVFAAVLSHFVASEILDHETDLTNRFVVSVAEAQGSQANLGPEVTLGQILDERADLAKLGVDAQAAAVARRQFFNYLRFLPDVRLADVFAHDRKIIWSTNRTLIGQIDRDDGRLESAFASRAMVSIGPVGRVRAAEEQSFQHQTDRLYVENYVPLYDAQGNVAVVARIYKEPGSLLGSLQRGKALVWAWTAFGAVFFYLALFRIVRRADTVLKAQRQRLSETEALCVVGEMSAAVAHGIRNPLASIRTSAELALDGDLESTKKNATDIIVQIDRLSKWVRDLLMFSRPLVDENQKIDLVALVDDCLPHFSAQFEKCGVCCDFLRPSTGLPRVVGSRALATQALASVISNAVEAMRDGGTLRLELKCEPQSRRVVLVASDTGAGMSRAVLDQVFTPYFTTKRNGLGLGMALVKRIMERFGGAISLDSREGEGTRVNLSFPVA